MPYSDPAKKQAYQKSYNRQYYRRNKVRKNLVNKAVNSKQNLRAKKRQYIWDHFDNKCCRCGFDENLRVVPRDPSRRAVWTSRGTGGVSGSDTPRYILDYSWDSLNGILPTLDLLCETCRNPKTPKTTAELAEKLSGLGSVESNLPRGYVLDEDLENL